MATVYILQSKSLDKFYIGSCKNLTIRIAQHKNNEFSNSFTGKATDWELFLSIHDLNYQQARKIESHIKKMKSKKYIRNLIKYPGIIEKLKQKYLNS